MSGGAATSSAVDKAGIPVWQVMMWKAAAVQFYQQLGLCGRACKALVCIHIHTDIEEMGKFKHVGKTGKHIVEG